MITTCLELRKSCHDLISIYGPKSDPGKVALATITLLDKEGYRENQKLSSAPESVEDWIDKTLLILKSRIDDHDDRLDNIEFPVQDE